MAGKFYLRNLTAANAPTAGEKSTALTASGANNATGSEETRSLSVAKGAAQTSITKAGDASTAARTNYMGRFTSDPLSAQTFGSGTWTLAICTNESNANANSFLAVSLYIWRPETSSVVAFIYDSTTALGSEWGAAEDGQVVTFTGVNQTSQAGDVLVLEVWRTASSQAMATSYNQVIYFDGTTDVVDATASDAASFLTPPANVGLMFTQTVSVTSNSNTPVITKSVKLIVALSSLMDGLLSYWKLEEAAGTSRADSHGSNTLTDHGTVGQTTGKQGNAASFASASTQYLQCAVGTLQSTDIDMTVAAWVQITDKTAERTILTNDYPGYILRYSNISDRFEFFWGSSNVVQADALGSPATSTWYFVVGWRNKTAGKIYIQVNNGTVNEHADETGVNGGVNFSIGQRGGGFNLWDGIIDEVGIWNRVLSDAERTSLYNSGSGVTYQLPVTNPKAFLTVLSTKITLLNSTVTSTASLVRVLMASVIRSVNSTASITKTQAAKIIRSVISTVTSTITKQANRIISTVTSTGTATLTATRALSRSVISTASITLTKSISKVFSLVSSSTTTILEKTTKVPFSVTSTGTPTAVGVLARIASVTSTGTSSILKQARKLFSLTSTDIPTTVKIIQTTKSVTSASTPSVIKLAKKTFSLVSTGTSSVIRSVQRIVSQTSSATVSKLMKISKSLANTSNQIATASVLNIRPPFSVTSSTTPSIQVTVLQTFLLTVSGTISYILDLFRTLVINSTAAISVIVNGGSTVVTRTELGTAVNKGGGGNWWTALTGITLNPNETLIVGYAAINAISWTLGVEFAGFTCPAATFPDGISPRLNVFYYRNLTENPITGDIRMYALQTFTDAYAMFAIKYDRILGRDSTVNDRDAVGSVSPNSGDAATPTPTTVLTGVFAIQGPGTDGDPTVTAGAEADHLGQRAGTSGGADNTNCTIVETYGEITTPDNANAAITLATSRGWMACIVRWNVLPDAGSMGPFPDVVCNG